MANTVAPRDLFGLHVVEIGRLTGVDMTTAAVYNVLNNGPRTILLIAATFSNFSAFPDGTALPSSFAFSWGLNSATTPNDMRAAGAFGAGLNAPCIKTQDITA